MIGEIIDKIRGPCLRSIGIELTNRCNCHCPMCYADGREKGFISEELFFKVMNELEPIKSIKQIGLNFAGESLLHPLFDDFVALVHETNPKWKIGLSTNGLLLYKHIDTFNKYIDFMNISMDAHDDTIQEKIIDIAYEIYKPYHRISLTTFNRTPGDIMNFKRKCHAWGVWPSVYPAIISDPNFHYGTGIYDDPLTKSIVDRTGHCRHPYLYMAILWNGDVTICCHDLRGRYVVGNINDSSLMEIWEGERYKKIRKQDRCEGCRIE